MNLDLVLGFITGMSFVIGLRTIMAKSKTMGIIQLLLTIANPILVNLWCAKKESFVFTGTDFEFLVQTAFVDKMIEPWVFLILYIVLIGLIIYNIIKISKKKMTN